jgi:hypothetical protein
MTPKREAFMAYAKAAAIGTERLAAATKEIERAEREGRDTTALLAAVHAYAEKLKVIVERRNQLEREIDPRLS